MHYQTPIDLNPPIYYSIKLKA